MSRKRWHDLLPSGSNLIDRSAHPLSNVFPTRTKALILFECSEESVIESSSPSIMPRSGWGRGRRGGSPVCEVVSKNGERPKEEEGEPGGKTGGRQRSNRGGGRS